MEKILVIFVLIPLLGFVVNVFVPRTNEKLMSAVAFTSMALQFVVTFIFTIFWVYNHGYILYTKELIIYKSDEIELFADFCFDKITAAYLMVGSLLSFLIIAYSRTYLHREGGYKRFFNTVMFFYLGYNILVLSGNLATFFIGWEVAGISSFLLIGYYRNRYIPVRNAVKIFSIYRLADLAFILGIWASHHIWHKNIVLLELENQPLVFSHIAAYPGLSVFFSVMILIAAAVKSAQLPFSSWLPRAMEGPTPSSAIFYSSLSVHAGLLLLLRTSHFWTNIPSIKIAIIALGILTFLVAGTTARVQSNIKSQIAYSSIAQIGLMFVEVAFGLDWLVLFHFAGNAFLRSYQLLISPSVVTYKIREQFYNFKPVRKLYGNGFIRKVKNSVFVLSLEEWFMDEFMHHSIWNFLKKIGKKLKFISLALAAIIMIGLFATAVYFVKYGGSLSWLQNYLPGLLAFTGVLFSLRSFTEKKNVYLVLLLVLFTHILIMLAVLAHTPVHTTHLIFYASGILVSGFVAMLCFNRLRRLGIELNLIWYQGHCYEHPKINFVFLLSCLGLTGFPVTTTFLGIELFYSYLHADQYVLLALISLALLVNSLSLIRMYARIFLGPHIKTYHEVARKSS